MIRLNIHEVKAHLSAYLDRLAKGETIILCKRKLLLPYLLNDSGTVESRTEEGAGDPTAMLKHF